MAPHLLDACSLINLVASGLDLRAVAVANDCQFAVTSVAAAEVLYLAPVVAGGQRQLIDVDVLVVAGLMDLVELEPLEMGSFVELARNLDDGEAATLAVAHARSLTVVTDDRKAQRVAQELGVPIITTAAIIRHWSQATPPPS